MRTPARLAAAVITAAFGASVLATPAQADGPGGGRPGDGHSDDTAVVDVSVATVWTSPDSPRPVDAPALGDPAHPTRWANAMTLAQKLDLSESNVTQTQALYGTEVHVLQRQGDWTEVAVPGQPTPKNDLGYPGWIPTTQLTTDRAYEAVADRRPFALVDEGNTTLFRDPALRHRLLRVSTNTRLPVLAQAHGRVLVATPGDGPAWLAASAVGVYRSDAQIPKATGAELVRWGKQFLGRPYVWAGRSGFGFDCSGFTGTIYQTHGITLPRDSGAQMDSPLGRTVADSDLKPGDLLFYGTPGHIHHVAMYAGDGRMIEAYSSEEPVRETAVRLGGDYAGAKRYL
ncbi:peptidase P60 [Marmoricola endophyticus]|uniref:Peptidase P60 n=1 Tax=Marmoricola endophyticus TaxID=2040280 RepID=A0A917BJM3_9ACTN|nr:C40 family peptidase [Marmoricola endophyticus]GGF45928.1 peptidase P60 [Marmoricola endophyticus]